ncbi:hypothetical protein [Shimia sagamensis]|nr:hypothetical protein [Shimia sagamensis]
MIRYARRQISILTGCSTTYKRPSLDQHIIRSAGVTIQVDMDSRSANDLVRQFRAEAATQGVFYEPPQTAAKRPQETTADR